MNTDPHAKTRQPAPFAAKINFKPGFLYQKKHREWTFRSDQFTFANAPAEAHFKAVQEIIREHNGQFIVASIFDNRLQPYWSDFPGKKPNNLVFQVCYSKIWVDRRKQLDLSFLEPTFDPKFIEYLGESFASDAYDNPVHYVAQEYKKSIGL